MYLSFLLNLVLIITLVVTQLFNLNIFFLDVYNIDLCVTFGLNYYIRVIV